MSGIFDFQALQVLSWNIISFLSLEVESSISQNIRNILRVDSIHLLSTEIYFLKYKQFFLGEGTSVSWKVRNFFFELFVSQNIRNIFVSFSWHVKNSLFWQNIRNFWQNIRNFLGVDLFYFSSLGLKVQCFISGSIRKAFFWENIRIFFRAGLF